MERWGNGQVGNQVFCPDCSWVVQTEVGLSDGTEVCVLARNSSTCCFDKQDLPLVSQVGIKFTRGEGGTGDHQTAFERLSGEATTRDLGRKQGGACPLPCVERSVP